MARRRYDTWEELEQHPPGPRRTLKWVIVAALLLFVVLPVTVWIFTMLSRPAQIASRVTDPDRLIATYEGYYDKCTAVVAFDANIADAAKALAAERKRQAADKASDPLNLGAQELQRLQTNLDGLAQRRREVAAEYNSQSLQITRLNGLTKGDDLPARIDDGATPQCGNGEAFA